MTEHQQRELAAGLKALAHSTRNASASDEVRARVASAILAAARPASALVASAPVASAFRRKFLPLAAALFLAIAASLWTARSSSIPSVEPSGFVALPEAGALPQMESAHIVRVSLPVAALPAYGVAVADFKVESVEAELLVAQDGHPRAIRLVNDSD